LPAASQGESHKFHSDYGSTDFGRENDIGITYIPIEWTWLTATFTY
jgi:hypothetical protein